MDEADDIPWWVPELKYKSLPYDVAALHETEEATMGRWW